MKTPTPEQASPQAALCTTYHKKRVDTESATTKRSKPRPGLKNPNQSDSSGTRINMSWSFLPYGSGHVTLVLYPV